MTKPVTYLVRVPADDITAVLDCVNAANMPVRAVIVQGRKFVLLMPDRGDAGYLALAFQDGDDFPVEVWPKK